MSLGPPSHLLRDTLHCCLTTLRYTLLCLLATLRCARSWSCAEPTNLANAFTVSLPQQQVLVWGPELPSFDDVTEKIAKTGKKITDKKVIENEADIPAITA